MARIVAKKIREGNEIGIHTADHCDLVMLQKDPNSATISGEPPVGACASPLSSATTALQEIQLSKNALTSNGFSPADTMAYPYGSYNSDTQQLLKQNSIIGARSVLAGFNTKSTNVYGLYTQIVNLNVTNAGIAQVKQWIDTAVANKQWLILAFHNIESLSALKANGDVDGTTPEFLQSIADYLKSKNVKVLTVHQGLNFE